MYARRRQAPGILGAIPPSMGELMHHQLNPTTDMILGSQHSFTSEPPTLFRSSSLSEVRLRHGC